MCPRLIFSLHSPGLKVWKWTDLVAGARLLANPPSHLNPCVGNQVFRSTKLGCGCRAFADMLVTLLKILASAAHSKLPEHSEITWVALRHELRGSHPMQRWKHHSDTGKLELSCKQHLGIPNKMRWPCSIIRSCLVPVTLVGHPLGYGSDILQSVRVHGTSAFHLWKYKSKPCSPTRETASDTCATALVSRTMPQLPFATSSTLTLEWGGCIHVQREFGPRISA